ncbi:MAG TPA: biotin/lipoyl-containing protein, partial [Pyrinomonadaceae bacterium]
MSTEVVMPQMGESIAEGTITKWLKKVGERVERDEPLFEISTDKVDAEIPSPAAGTLTEILFNEGETVEVNKVVAVLDGNSAGAGAAAPAKETQQEPPKQTQQETVPKAATEETPKVETPAPAVQPKAEPAPAPQQTAPAAPAVARAPEPARAEARPTAQGATVEDLRRTKSSPLVRRIAEEHGVDITQLEGTGMSGRVTKNDILSFIESGAAPAPVARPTAPPVSPAALPEPTAPPPPKPLAGDRVEQMSVMRKKIA